MSNSQKFLNIKLIKILLLFLLVVGPWTFPRNSDEIEVKKIDDSNIGYYQVNTCTITLQEIFLENFGSDNIVYKFDNYSSIRCFGKVNGLDKVNGEYHVGIGSNLLINLITQSIFWLLLFSLVPKEMPIKLKNKSLTVFLITSLNVLHIFGEDNFYNLSSRNVDYTLSLDNFFLLSFILIFILIVYTSCSIAEGVSSRILIFSPFLFLIN